MPTLPDCDHETRKIINTRYWKAISKVKSGKYKWNQIENSGALSADMRFGALFEAWGKEQIQAEADQKSIVHQRDHLLDAVDKTRKAQSVSVSSPHGRAPD